MKTNVIGITALVLASISAAHAEPDPCVFEPARVVRNFAVEIESGAQNFHVRAVELLHDACPGLPAKSLSFHANPLVDMGTGRLNASIAYIGEDGLPNARQRGFSELSNYSIGVPREAQEALLQGRPLRIQIGNSDIFNLRHTSAIIRLP